MAPEVIEHSPYGERADVFSFGVVMWEMLTGRVPYENMTPLQAAVGVVQKGLRPPIPAGWPTGLTTLLQRCWTRKADDRPSFEALKVRLLLFLLKLGCNKHLAVHMLERPCLYM